MRIKVTGCVICALIIFNAFFMTISLDTSASSTTIEYQIGTRRLPGGDTWSPWMSDGQVANVTSNVSPTDFMAKIKAPGYHVEYQIGTRRLPGGDTWSPWRSDGQVANVTTNISPTYFLIKIKAPGYHVEYQIGTRRLPGGETWSPWMSDGQTANVSSNVSPINISLKIIMTVPEKTIVDIDPDTLNLRSKGRWITCYIDLPDQDVKAINLSTILLEDAIPSEWGDIQGDILMIKFDRSDIEDMLSPGVYNLKVTGKLKDGSEFEGYSDEITVIDPPKK
jgi:hypothetical protein